MRARGTMIGHMEGAGFVLDLGASSADLPTLEGKDVRGQASGGTKVGKGCVKRDSDKGPVRRGPSKGSQCRGSGF